jgi:hypothetical protein
LRAENRVAHCCCSGASTEWFQLGPSTEERRGLRDALLQEKWLSAELAQFPAIHVFGVPSPGPKPPFSQRTGTLPGLPRADPVVTQIVKEALRMAQRRGVGETKILRGDAPDSVLQLAE